MFVRFNSRKNRSPRRGILIWKFDVGWEEGGGCDALLPEVGGVYIGF